MTIKPYQVYFFIPNIIGKYEPSRMGDFNSLPLYQMYMKTNLHLRHFKHLRLIEGYISRLRPTQCRSLGYLRILSCSAAYYYAFTNPTLAIVLYAIGAGLDAGKLDHSSRCGSNSPRLSSMGNHRITLCLKITHLNVSA